MPLTPERHTAEPAQPVSEREGYDAQGAPASGRPEGDSPRGVFVTFEGGDGVGKSTHIRYAANELRRAGREVVCLREPGGTGIGESLRAMVLDPDNGEISSEAELLMYEAARAQLVREVIRPALERGAVVLCDRFSDSTIAYGRGLPLDFVRRANAFATGGIVPDRTILLVLGNTRKSLARATGAGTGDRMEQAGEVFHSRVNRAFLKLAKRDPKRIRIARSSFSVIFYASTSCTELADILPELSARAEGATPSQPAAPQGEGAAKGKPQAKRKRGGRGKRGNRG